MKNTGNLNRGPYVEVSLYIPVSLLEEVDRLVSEGKYESRSRLVREAIRQLLSKLTGKPHEEGEAVRASTARAVARRVNLYNVAKGLLRDYIIHELSDGRFKANIKDNNSPVMLTLTQFRAFVWRRAKTEDSLKMYVKKVSRKSTTTVMEDRPRRRDLLAYAWQMYTVKYLDELKVMGIVREWWRKKTTIGYKYYVVVSHG